jgi:hypothetical protein
MHGAIPPLPQYVFMAWCLAKYRDNFTFYFYLEIEEATHVRKAYKVLLGQCEMKRPLTVF